jgi:hypothetical protein
MKLAIQTICVLMTAMIGTALPARPGAGERAMPFRGSLRGVVQITDVQFPTMLAVGNDTGNATHLGRFAAAWEEEVDLLTNTGIGSGQFVAANGDRISYEFTGQATPTGSPNEVLVVEVATVTGGTGRFAGASGDFIAELVVDLGTGLSAGFFEGTILIPRAK